MRKTRVMTFACVCVCVSNTVALNNQSQRLACDQPNRPCWRRRCTRRRRSRSAANEGRRKKKKFVHSLVSRRGPVQHLYIRLCLGACVSSFSLTSCAGVRSSPWSDKQTKIKKKDRNGKREKSTPTPPPRQQPINAW